MIGATPPLRVLIVDDSRDDAELTELALRDAGIEVDCRRAQALGLGVVVWLPSIAELFVHHPNNLTQIVRWATSGTGDPIGFTEGATYLNLIAPAPGGFRRSTEDLLVDGTGPATVLGVGLVLLLAVIATGYRVPKGRASSAWPARVALAANIGMLLTASRLPEWPLAPYWVITWLPVAAFTWCALVWRGLAYLDNATPHLRPRVALPLGGGLVAGGVAATALALPPAWAEIDSMTAVARAAGADLGDGQGRHVQIRAGFHAHARGVTRDRLAGPPAGLAAALPHVVALPGGRGPPVDRERARGGRPALRHRQHAA